MLIDIFKAIILGIIEGITEFLPISSTGHLILANQWLTFEKSFTVLFDIVIQLGAILSVLVYFRKKLWPLGKEPQEQQATLSLWKKTLVGVLPALFFGFLLSDLIEKNLFNPLTVILALMIGGVVLLLIERKKRLSRINTLAELNFQTAFLIGLFQCLAMIPGTSRSAATIIGAMLLGASRQVAVEFSFFLAIPTMLAASGYSLLKNGAWLSFSETVVLVTGFLVSFLVAWAVIKFFILYIQKNDLRFFGCYRIILGVVLTLLFFI